MSVLERIAQSVASEPALRSAFQAVERDRVAYLSGLTCSAKPLALARLVEETGRPVLAIVPSQEEAESILADLEVVLGEERTYFFPETEVIPYDTRSTHVGLLGERIPALEALRCAEPCIVLTTARAISGRIVPPDVFATFAIPLARGQEVPFDEFRDRLVALGFRTERIVEEIGSFAVRGGLVDLFPFGSRYPVRVEFFGDEIESIRRFDPQTQRTIEEVEDVVLLPQREMRLDEAIVSQARARGSLPFDEGEDPFVDGIDFYLPRFYPELGSLFDYFHESGTLVLDEPGRLREQLEEHDVATRSGFESMRERGHRVPEPTELWLSQDDLANEIVKRRTLRLSLFRGDSSLGALGGEPSVPEDARAEDASSLAGDVSRQLRGPVRAPARDRRGERSRLALRQRRSARPTRRDARRLGRAHPARSRPAAQRILASGSEARRAHGPRAVRADRSTVSGLPLRGRRTDPRLLVAQTR